MRYTLYMVALAAAMLAHEARAQEVRGRVTDAEGRAVEPATVAVFRGDRQLAADVTDTAGRFRLAAPDGPYTLRVRHVAYRPLDTLISVRGRSGDELSLVMAEASVGLGEVTVQAERVVREADRFVVHVGDAPAMAGRDGAELLRTAPGVWVTDDGRRRVSQWRGRRAGLCGRPRAATLGACADGLRAYAAGGRCGAGGGLAPGRCVVWRGRAGRCRADCAASAA